MVEQVLAKDQIRVRFPVAAQKYCPLDKCLLRKASSENWG